VRYAINKDDAMSTSVIEVSRLIQHDNSDQSEGRSE